jgi:excisionase family DNA binding protein
MSDRVVLSMKEVGHRLGVSPSFLYDEINRGKLSTIKLAKRRLVHVDDLAAYIAANRHEAKAA